MISRRSFTVLAAGAAAFPIIPAAADAGFQTWLQGVRREALAQGVDAGTLDRAFRGVEPIPRVLELDRSQPEFKLTWQEYLDRVVSEERVARGRELARANAALLNRIGDSYGVPPKVIVALWGIESHYGTKMGTFSVVGSLATLAYNGRRPKYFRAELLAALKILAQGHITPDRMVGSWAGAMGQCQFMPTSFLALAVDGDGDGKRDIWGSKADVFASAANFLRKSGWQQGVGWGEEVTGKPGATAPAGGRVVTPEGAGGRTYLTTANFKAIRRWNPSDFFALAVGILSDRIAA
ncbi:lytic murein transglycosylase [Vineibacter terrae]|uniref:Lytic murein transglycosylase n=1 Tax=Vineibacter terrae TaxID=2586908 RepID=A0A5C8PEI4_9HYPH|nr:lytic murein transglycosylase [Vineibacter terrae]TXL72183.1 lytic murein transglycosylase [Vineibacter terrae]